jgi:hypothetical protein
MASRRGIATGLLAFLLVIVWASSHIFASTGLRPFHKSSYCPSYDVLHAAGSTHAKLYDAGGVKFIYTAPCVEHRYAVFHVQLLDRSCSEVDPKISYGRKGVASRFSHRRDDDGNCEESEATATALALPLAHPHVGGLRTVVKSLRIATIASTCQWPQVVLSCDRHAHLTSQSHRHLASASASVPSRSSDQRSAGAPAPLPTHCTLLV